MRERVSDVTPFICVRVHTSSFKKNVGVVCFLVEKHASRSSKLNIGIVIRRFPASSVRIALRRRRRVMLRDGWCGTRRRCRVHVRRLRLRGLDDARTRASDGLHRRRRRRFHGAGNDASPCARVAILNLYLLLRQHARRTPTRGEIRQTIHGVRQGFDIRVVCNHRDAAQAQRELLRAQHEADETVITLRVHHSLFVLNHEASSPWRSESNNTPRSTDTTLDWNVRRTFRICTSRRYSTCTATATPVPSVTFSVRTPRMTHKRRRNSNTPDWNTAR